MKTIDVTQKFRFAHDGIRVVEYLPGVHEVTDQCAQVAVAEKWARETTKKAGGPPPAPGGNTGPNASQKAIALASAEGVNLTEITGTGNGGAITASDVKNHIAAKEEGKGRKP